MARLRPPPTTRPLGPATLSNAPFASSPYSPNVAGQGGGLGSALGGRVARDVLGGAGSIYKQDAPQFNEGVSWQQALAAAQAQSAPEMAMLGGTIGNIQSLISQASAEYANQRDLMGQEHQLGLDKLAQMGGIAGIDQASIERQQRYLDAVLGIEGQRFDTANTTMNTLRALTEDMYLNQLKRHGLSEKSAKAGSAEAKRQAVSNAISRGAMFTPGHEEDIDFIAGQLAMEIEGIQLDRNDTETTINEKRAQFNKQAKDLLYDFDLTKLSIGEQKAKLQDREGQLRHEAEIRKIEERELALRLAQGLGNLGLAQIMSVGQLMDALAQAQSAQAKLAMDAAMQASQWAGSYLNIGQQTYRSGGGVYQQGGSASHRGTTGYGG